MLDLDGVVKHYARAGEVIRAVDGVTLTIAPSELVALYGPSGSGKTTLLLLVAALMAPDAGAVSFDGRDLSSLSGDEVADYQRRDIGFVYQSFHLFSRVSAIDNAAMKLLAGGTPVREARRAAIPWLERVGLSDRLHHTPEELSGGERQRVAMARALAGDPRLILADEPTGNLDSRRGGETLSLLAEICREREAAVLLVTHDPRATTIADRAHTLIDGHLQAGPEPIAGLDNALSSPAGG